FEDLKNYCSNKNLIFLSTPFDDNSVELLDKLNVPVFKIGSGDMNNFPLLKLICSKNKPIFLSTGMATLNEVKLSVGFLRSNNIDEIVIFQCTSSYPAAYEDVNLNVIDTFKQEFPDLLIGFSDHSLGIEASVGAVAKGVKVVEKHFTLDKNMEGPDHKSSLDPIELNQWVLSIRNLEKALGGYDKKPSNIELEISKVARKSVVSIKEIRKGEILTKEKIAIKRPGYGISPINLEKIIGMKVKRDISKDSIIYWEDIE
ncbi:MAG: N-acetylneuraminate synthase family protein, partial [Candidatus Heimdallarchaeota archaeon]